jgi:hypothetical protein
MVCKLVKSFYGLKEFPCTWNHKIDAYFFVKKFERSYVDHTNYFKMIYGNSFVIIILYVDNFILVCNYLILLRKTKENLLNFFEMMDT